MRHVSASRCGKKVDYRFYTQLEQILGQEAVSMDEYDKRDEQADQDPGMHVFRPPAKVRKSVSSHRRLCASGCRWRELFLDGAGDGRPHRGVGGGRRATQPEDLRAQQPHFRRDRGEDDQRGVPQDGGAVPVPDETAEEDVQALLQHPEVKPKRFVPSVEHR